MPVWLNNKPIPASWLVRLERFVFGGGGWQFLGINILLFALFLLATAFVQSKYFANIKKKKFLTNDVNEKLQLYIFKCSC